MTKKEKIKEAWGNQYSNDVIMEGRRCGFKIVDNIEYAVNYKGGDWYCEPHTFETIAFMPTILREYLNNNGWIKIESKEDLPRQENNLWLLANDGSLILGRWCIFEKIFKTSYGNNFDCDGVVFTHYQPIQKPKPPLY